MTRAFGFHPEARSELRAAVEYYESENRGVGVELLTAVRSAIDHVLDHPLSRSHAQSGTRRKVLMQFPYSLIYLFEQGEVIIIAVAHQRRRPGYWRNRVR